MLVTSPSQLNVRDLRSAFAGLAELPLSTEGESQMPVFYFVSYLLIIYITDVHVGTSFIDEVFLVLVYS